MKMKILANNNNLYNNLIKRSRILLLLFIILLNGCTTSSKISIFYSGNINGILENCRCPKVSEGSILNHISFY
ncbi:MAG: hypothetical protein L6407_05460, partial [Candidatus Delongbacteria bacterium]|nr:hypothetical protein [Candidatus Delongbacteria bacterium]